MSLAHFAAVHVRGFCVDSPLQRVRLRAEVERLEAEVGMLREELRIKDARLEKVPPRQRPHYAPRERMAVLLLRAARGWSLAQTAARFLVSCATLSTWNRRAADDADRLVQVPVPVNRYPDFVGQVVEQLKRAVPSMGKARIAQLLARAGLHLGVTTVQRLLKRRIQVEPPTPFQPKPPRKSTRIVAAKRPHHVWNIDLTEVPTSAGRSVPWLPFRLPEGAPFSRWLLVVLDHFSRRVIGFAVFDGVPSSTEVVAALDTAVQRIGRTPKHIISDQGVHFQAKYREWCARHGVKHRYGAVGQHGSIAVLERFFLSLKEECLRRVLVPMRTADLRALIERYCRWYEQARPHQGLGGATPIEAYQRRKPASDGARFEPRARYPAKTRLRARRGTRLELVVDGFEGEQAQRMPVVSIRRAA